jgi:hypothetical protein
MLGATDATIFTQHQGELAAYKRTESEVEAALVRAGGVPQPEIAEYLKDGETVLECVQRNRRDVDAVLTLLSQAKTRIAELEARAGGVETPPEERNEETAHPSNTFADSGGTASPQTRASEVDEAAGTDV